MATKGSQLLLAVLLVACGPSGPQVDVEAERSAVLEADRAWSQTPPDVDAFVSNFTTDGAFLGGNAPAAEGIEAVRSSTREMFGAPGFALSWSASRADVSACGDLAYTVGTYEITSNDAAGNAQTRPGKYVTVWKKQADGTWRVVVDAPSENAPPAPPPAPPFERAERPHARSRRNGVRRPGARGSGPMGRRRDPPARERERSAPGGGPGGAQDEERLRRGRAGDAE
jgi:ketosteroid isomerase-like protein